MPTDADLRARSPSGDAAFAPAGAWRGSEAVLALTAMLAEASTPSAVAEGLAQHAMGIFLANWIEVWLSSREAGGLALAAMRGRPSAASLVLERVAPLAAVLRGGEPRWIEQGSVGGDAVVSALFEGDASRAIACLPLDVGEKSGGLVLLGFERAPSDPSVRRVASLLARQTRLALERTRLLESMREASVRAEALQQLLAESTAVLTSSLDYEQSFAALTRLAVPRLASLAIAFGPRRDGGFGVIAATHVDEASAGQLGERLPSTGDSALGRVLATGEPFFAPTLDAASLAQLAAGEDLPSRIVELRLCSLMIVPLTARGRSFGALSLGSNARSFTAQDLAVARELAARAALHVDNARLLDEARAAVWLRDDFLGIAGHELKTPITALQLGLQSLVRSPGAREATAKRIALCHRQVERLSKLVDELLDVSRITAGRLALELEEVDLAQVVEDAVTRMSEDFAKAGCEVTATADGPVLGRWDRMRLDQIVTNLLSNALKYGKGRPIKASVVRTSVGAALSVSDEGIGVALEDQTRIFERFERAVSQRNYGGLGLGLWIVRQIVEAFGGTVRVRSVMGSGACFTVEIPLVPPDAALTLR